MKKQLLSVFSILFYFSASAQYEYSPTGRNDAPSLGKVMGFVGGGFTSMLNNRDDISADQRLDPQMMNFSYAGGIEIMSWFQHTIGFGGQLMYWQGGAAYLGEDTISKMKLTAKTTMTYAKMPLMFYFKSYNRYYPNRRFRFNSSFGPYVAMLLSYNDYVKIYNDDWKVSRESTFSGTTFTGKATGAQDTKGKITSSLYNPFDLGFVFALGGEARLWRRTIISLNLRTDIGFSNVENTRKMKINYNSSNTDLDFAYWNSLYAKYNSPNALDVTKGWEANRPATKNFSMGAFLTIKKYMSR